MTVTGQTTSLLAGGSILGFATCMVSWLLPMFILFSSGRTKSSKDPIFVTTLITKTAKVATA